MAIHNRLRLPRLDHLRKVRDHFGAPAALLRIGDRVIQSLGCEVHKVLWQEYGAHPQADAGECPFLFHQLTATEVEAYAADPQYRIPASFPDRLRSGKHLCFSAFDGSRLVAYGWFALGDIDADQNAGVPMSYPADTTCVYRAFTHPDFRGQHVHATIRPQVLAALAQYGLTKIVALVSWTNWPSRRYCSRVGYEDLGHLLSVGPRDRRRWWAPRQATERGIRFGTPTP